MSSVATKAEETQPLRMAAVHAPPQLSSVHGSQPADLRAGRLDAYGARHAEE
jgi:hypothetical protein